MWIMKVFCVKCGHISDNESLYCEKCGCLNATFEQTFRYVTFLLFIAILIHKHRVFLKQNVYISDEQLIELESILALKYAFEIPERKEVEKRLISIFKNAACLNMYNYKTAIEIATSIVKDLMGKGQILTNLDYFFQNSDYYAGKILNNP